MRRIAAIVCGFLFIVFFGFAFGGSSTGHRVRIVVRHHPNQNDESESIPGRTESDLPNGPLWMDMERCTASLGLEGNNHHFRWDQKKAIPGRYSIATDFSNEIKDALPVLLRNADQAEIRKFRDSTSNTENMPLIYCTITDVL